MFFFFRDLVDHWVVLNEDEIKLVLWTTYKMFNCNLYLGGGFIMLGNITEQ